MIKRYSRHLIGYGSLLFFIGLFTLQVDIITINLVIPTSTVMVGLGTIGWMLKGKPEQNKTVRYASKVDEGLGILWEKVIPRFWTGIIILLMIFSNPFAHTIHQMKRNFRTAQKLSADYEPIVAIFGTDLDFGNVNAWSHPNDTTTTFKFKLSGNKHDTELIELTLSHGAMPHLNQFNIVEE